MKSVERYIYIAVATILTIILFLTVRKESLVRLDQGFNPNIIPGTKLRLVTEYKSLRIRIFADTTSSNRFPDYAVYEGDMLVFLRQNTISNTNYC